MNIRRHLALLIPIMLTCSAMMQAQTPTWKRVEPAGFGEFVTAFSFPTKDSGFATSWAIDGSQSHGSLLRTTDRGSTWKATPVENMQPSDLTFTTTKFGVMVGKSLDCGCPALLSTTNGGNSWMTFTYPGTGTFNHIYFLDLRNGFITGNGMLMRTATGGATWENVTPPNLAGLNLLMMSFPTPTTGYLVASDASHAATDLVFKSIDGGTTWTKVYDGSVAGDGVWIYDMQFIDAGVGVFAGRVTSQAMFKTEDAGITLTRTFTPKGTPPPGAMSVVDFASKTLGYAAGSEGLVLRTTDGGTTWKGEASGITDPLTAIAVLDENTVIVGSVLGGMAKRTAVYKPEAVLSTDRLDFGTVTDRKEMTVTITPANQAGVRIEELSISDTTVGFTLVEPTAPAPYVLGPSGSLAVVVRFTSSAGLPDEPITDLMIRTNNDQEPVMRVTLLARQEGGELPSAVLSTDSLAFGEVPGNRTLERSFTIGAENGAGLILTELSVSGQDAARFSVTAPGSLPATITAGTPLEVVVRFTPGAPGSTHAARLIVRTNDGGEPERQIKLAGSAGSPVASAPNGPDDRNRLTISAHPNPTSSGGTITIACPARAHMTATIFNAIGERVATLFNGTAAAGSRAFTWNASGLPAGFYYCVVETDDGRAVKEITVVR